MLDLIASLMVRGLNRVLHVLPIRFNLWVGRRVGTLIYFLSGKRARIAYANLKAAFCGEKTPRELRRITKKVYINLAQTFAELLSMTKADKEYIDRYVNIINMDRIEKASKNKNGMILLSAHYGNWELSTVASVMKGFPLHLLARDQKMQRLYELMNELRESKGNIVIRKGADVKNIFRVLHKGGGVGILGDQNAGPHGELIEFFGRPASTAVGPFRIAQKSGAVILPAFISRKDGPSHDLELEELMSIGRKEDPRSCMERYVRLLEKHLRKHPDQWLWMHKKWKMTPVRCILVLDDGKKGHLKQSLAVVKQIERYRRSEGFDAEHTKVDTVPVKFRSKTAKFLFNLMTPLFSRGSQGRMNRLRWALDKESYEAAVNRYADVIVSCGSGLYGVNRMLKIENNARSIVVLDPGAKSREKFDVVVIPEHDIKDRMKGENIVVTDMAPNLIDGPSLGPFKAELDKEGLLRGGFRLGVLVGGDNAEFGFGESLVRDLAKNIKIVCEQEDDGYFYITTSRRTPEPAEYVLRKELEGFPRCGMFVSGRSDTDEYTVEKILAASDIVVVSGESISMVSEAVSSGKPVLVFMPDKKTGKVTKYERFVERLREKGYLLQVNPGDMPGVVADIIGGKEGRPSPADDDRILEKMYKLF